MFVTVQKLIIFIITTAVLFPHIIFAQEQPFAKSQEIESFIQQEMKETNMPGVSVSIVKGNEVVYQKGFGVTHNDSSPHVTPQTPFFIGSVSKTITTLAVMQLVDQNKITIDKPIQTYIPWFQVADPEASKRITLKHLLTHTSGIPSSADFPIQAETVEQRVKNLQHIELISIPGETYHYAGPNYQIIAVLIEEISGMSFEEYLKQNIFIPLEMKNTFISLEEAEKSGLTSGHMYFFGQELPIKHTFEKSRLASGQMISTVEDLSHVAILQLNEGKYKDTQLISAETFKKMYEVNIKGEETSVGLTWRISKENNIPIIWHGGSLSNFLAELFIAPQEKWGVVVLGNSNSMIDSNMTERIARGVIRILHNQELPTVKSFSLNTLYILITIVCLSIAGIKVWQLVFSLRKAPKSKEKMSFLKNVIWPPLEAILIPLVILYIVALIMRVPLEIILFHTMPDIVLVTIIIAIIDAIRSIILAVKNYSVLKKMQ